MLTSKSSSRPLALLGRIAILCLCSSVLSANDPTLPDIEFDNVRPAGPMAAPSGVSVKVLTQADGSTRFDPLILIEAPPGAAAPPAPPANAGVIQPQLKNTGALSASYVQAQSLQALGGMVMVARTRLRRDEAGWQLLPADAQQELAFNARMLGCTVAAPLDFAVGVHHKWATAVAIRRMAQTPEAMTMSVRGKRYRGLPAVEEGCVNFSAAGPLYVQPLLSASEVLTIEGASAESVAFELPRELFPHALIELVDGRRFLAPARADTVVFDADLSHALVTWRAVFRDGPEIRSVEFRTIRPPSRRLNAQQTAARRERDQPILDYLHTCPQPQRYSVEPCSHPDFFTDERGRKRALARIDELRAASAEKAKPHGAGR